MCMHTACCKSIPEEDFKLLVIKRGNLLDRRLACRLLSVIQTMKSTTVTPSVSKFRNQSCSDRGGYSTRDCSTRGRSARDCSTSWLHIPFIFQLQSSSDRSGSKMNRSPRAQMKRNFLWRQSQPLHCRLPCWRWQLKKLLEYRSRVKQKTRR